MRKRWVPKVTRQPSPEGTTGPSYQLYGSSDLTNWTQLTNGIALTTGTNTLTGYDPIEPPRFYKLEGR